MLPSRFVSLALGFASVLIAAPVVACGVSGPGGSVGCSLAEHNEAAHPWTLGASAVYTSTALHFSTGVEGDQTRAAVLASLSRRLSHRWAIETEIGAAFGGELRMPDGSYKFSPGPTAALGASYRVVDGRPFLLATSLLSLSGARTEREGSGERANYEAYNLRLGALFGTTLFDALSPYAVARVFGGPVFWRYRGASVTGTDTSHFQLGAGLVLDLGRSIQAFAEGIPLGERAVSGGLALRL